MDEEEAFWREADRRYQFTTIERIRIGTVTGFTDTQHFDVQLIGKDRSEPAMTSISFECPVVGDQVRVAFIDDDPVILDIINNVVMQHGQFTVNLAATSGASASPTFPVPYPAGVSPRILHSVTAGSNFDVLSNVQARSNTGFTLRVFQKDSTAITATITVDWLSLG